jgi:sec-independent protein translocase protein TatA
MGTFSIWHWLIVLAIVLLLFGGAGKIPKLMRDMGQGINAFKKGLKEDDKERVEASADRAIEADQNAVQKDKAAS